MSKQKAVTRKSSGITPRREDHVIWKTVKGRGILINLEDGSYFEVDPVGLTIWKLCDGRTDLGSIAQAVAKEFKASLAQVTRDLPTFVLGLKRKNLLVT